jgi:hypothetical protein
MFALSEPGRLEEVLVAAGLHPRDDEEVECTIRFEDVDTAARAFIGAGPTALAVQQSGEGVVADAVRTGLDAFTDAGGHVSLPGWYRTVIAEV